MNPAIRLPRVNPWIVALAVALVLLVVTALTLLVVEPGLLRAIGTALHSPWHVTEECGGGGVPC